MDLISHWLHDASVIWRLVCKRRNNTIKLRERRFEFLLKLMKPEIEHVGSRLASSILQVLPKPVQPVAVPFLICYLSTYLLFGAFLCHVGTDINPTFYSIHLLFYSYRIILSWAIWAALFRVVYETSHKHPLQKQKPKVIILNWKLSQGICSQTEITL